MRPQNVIIFSAGESLPKVNYLKEELRSKDIICSDWKELFGNAHNSNNIALLPILSKKIPSFDFALILAESVDSTVLRGTDTVKAMRDNVVFEMGLCIMALGVDRVILLAEDGVRLPDDLTGIDKVGVKLVQYTSDEFGKAIKEIETSIQQRSVLQSIYPPVDNIAQYISKNSENVSPVFVGAAIASAEAYFLNFIVRLIENTDKPFYRKDNPQEKLRFPDDLKITVGIPQEITSDTRNSIMAYYKKHGIDSFCIDNASVRDLYFNGQFTDNQLTVIDIPTSITASYSVVNSILSIESDDEFDRNAQARFIAKELDIYEYALIKFITPEVARKRLDFIHDKSKLEYVVEKLQSVRIVKMEIQ